MARNAKRIYAPYVYLVQDSNGIYKLSIVVPVSTGERVSLSNPTYQNGQTVIAGNIINDATQSNQFLQSVISLDPRGNIPLDAQGEAEYEFEPENFKIALEINKVDSSGNTERFKTTLIYSNADLEYADDALLGNTAFALNAPHIHLNKESQEDYTPHLIIPIAGASLHSERVNRTSPDLGVCESLVLLEEVSSQGNSFLSDGLNINSIQYSDTGKVEGYFTGITYIDQTTIISDFDNNLAVNSGNSSNEPKKKKKKVRLDNKSSDGA